MPLLNLPLGLLSSARFAPVAASMDLRERDESRLPIEGLLGAEYALSCESDWERDEEELAKRASMPPPPVKEPEERRNELELMKRGLEGEGGAASSKDACVRSGLDGCASCRVVSRCDVVMVLGWKAEMPPKQEGELQ